MREHTCGICAELSHWSQPTTCQRRKENRYAAHQSGLSVMLKRAARRIQNSKITEGRRDVRGRLGQSALSFVLKNKILKIESASDNKLLKKLHKKCIQLFLLINCTAANTHKKEIYYSILFLCYSICSSKI